MSADKERQESTDSDDEPVAANSFANDGSFLEQFRKSMQKEQEQKPNDDDDESEKATKTKDEEKEREAERFIAGYMGQMKVMRVNNVS